MDFSFDSSAMNGLMDFGGSSDSGSSGWGWDTITGAASTVFGGIGTAANTLGGWAKDNPGGALILGSGISATGQYIAGRASDKSAAKREKDAFNRESKRYDELHQTVNTDFGDPIMDPGTLAGNAPLTNEGLLTNMQQTNPDNNKNKLAV